MKQGFDAYNSNDENGNPTGGGVLGCGIDIRWQEGPLSSVEVEGVTVEVPLKTPLGDRYPNGAFVEDVIDAAIQRLEFFQGSKFACEENAEAIRHLRAANESLDSRTKRRIEAGVQGTHAIAPGDAAAEAAN